MSTLSKSEAGPSVWGHLLVKYHKPVCFALCLIGYLWFCLLAHKSFNNVNYFSENALLPGLVQSDLVEDGSAKQFFNELQNEVNEKYGTHDGMPTPWLTAKMHQLNLDVYTHNFSLQYPLGRGQMFHGENVYGIMRAGRTASTEALVLSSPYRPPHSHHKGTLGGIALMLAFAKFAKSRKYWAKDLIFLVTAHEQLGAQAWLEAYHGQGGEEGDSCLKAGELRGRAGAIQAAINLEMSTLDVRYMEVKIEGLNGQLPNLDLVNLVHKMCFKSNVQHAYKNSYSWVTSQDSWKSWMSGLGTLFSMVTTQVTGVPTGNHGLFHRYGIEALTLEGMTLPPAGSRAPPRGGRPQLALEGILRSLNNLLERFHQSFFFYLRPATDRFVSIGQYMPPLGALAGALFIRAFALCLSTQKKPSEDEDKTKDSPKKDDEKSKDPVKKPDDSIEEEDAEEKEEEGVKLMNVGIVYLSMHAIGYAVMCSPQLISEIGIKYFNLPTEQVIFLGLASLAIILTATLPVFLRRALGHSDLRLLHALAAMQMATLCLAVAMHNFSLGFCMVAVYAPVALVIDPYDNQGRRRSRVRTFACKCLWVCVHPLVLLTASVCCVTAATFPEESLPSLLTRALHASHHAVMFSIVDAMIYGNWLFNIVTSILLPVWLLFWLVVSAKLD